MEQEIENIEEAREFVAKSGYPVTLLPLFSLGVSFIASSSDEMEQLFNKARDLSLTWRVMLRS